MKRPPGVIVSTIFLLLGSLFQLLMAVCMALAGAIVQGQIRSGIYPGAAPAMPMPAWMPIFMYAICAFCVALTSWGILTAVGLFRLRRWARYSILVIAGCLTLIGLPAMLISMAMLVVPLPVAPSVDPSQANTVHAMTRIMFAVIAFFYAITCTLGISWLAYFNLKKVRDLFTATPGQIAESRRPFLISVIAVLSIFGAASCLLMAFLPFPGALFGMILCGWQRATVYLLYAVLLAAAGVGLWRLEEWGRRLSLAMQAVGLLQYVVLLARPSLMTSYATEISRTMNLPQSQPPVQLPNMFYIPVFAFGTLFVLAIVWVLVRYRSAFRPPIAPPPTESPALP